MKKNIELVEALSIINALDYTTDVIQVPLIDALNSVLAEDVFANHAVPSFDKSPLDGFAIRASDVTLASRDNPITLNIIATVHAGDIIHDVVGKNQAVRIMTGAKIPLGADAVIKFEDTIFTEEIVVINYPLNSGDNIILEGEDVKQGDKVLKKGTLIKPAEIGILAMLGMGYVHVYRKPRVAIISTGDELLDLHLPLSDGKIRNSNAYMIAALVKNIGALPEIVGICSDRLADIVAKIKPTLSWADLILTTGGVSVGDHDLVKEAFTELGADLLFWRVKMKPGTPIAFAMRQQKFLIGLSGNPAAAYITFEQFVRPVLMRLMGKEQVELMQVDSVLDSAFSKTSSTNRFIRARTYYKDGQYRTFIPEKHSSGVLSSLSGTNSLIFVSANTGPYCKGESIVVQLLEHLEVFE